jgi:hypothetical protein
LRLAAPAQPISEYLAVSEGAANEDDDKGANWQPEESRPRTAPNGLPPQIDAASEKIEELLGQILDQLKRSEQVRVQI